MVVSVFPDNRTVLLGKLPPTSDMASDQPQYFLPTIDVLQMHGIPVPDTPWDFGRPGRQSETGLFVDSEQLASILASLQNPAEATGRSTPPPIFEVTGRREAFDLLDSDTYWAMSRTFHTAFWDKNTRFCGACATPMERSDEEMSKVCPSCGQQSYPRISPAVIMAVVKDGELLMAHSTRHPGNLYSVLAGFVEPGETLEHAVSREVFEESGVLVRNIEYFSSQPWPYPNSLMIAFSAEYAGGTLRPEPGEIDHVDWYRPSDLPDELPGTYSVARRLIEWFVGEYGDGEDFQRLLAR